MIERIPFIITVFGMALGIFIAILFGINEDIFKGYIKDEIKISSHYAKVSPVQKEAYFKKEYSKNWRYFQRFHFHSTGIGAMTLAMLLFLAFLEAPKNLKSLTSYALSVGGFFYPFVWLFAGIYGPIWGRSVAKENFAIFAYMGGVFLAGTLLTTYLASRYSLVKKS